MRTKFRDAWKSQKRFLKELAEINGIEFDPDKFPDRTKRRGLLKTGYLQSDAALYVAKQIDMLKKNGVTIFFPWNTSPVRVGFNGWMYSQSPWSYFPVAATPKQVNDTDLIAAVSIDESGGPENYLGNDARRIGVMLICKGCHHEWKHHCGSPGLSGLVPANPDDILEAYTAEGKAGKAFRCPLCGSTEVFKRGEFRWD